MEASSLSARAVRAITLVSNSSLVCDLEVRGAALVIQAGEPLASQATTVLAPSQVLQGG